MKTRIFLLVALTLVLCFSFTVSSTLAAEKKLYTGTQYQNTACGAGQQPVEMH